tara:strand:- start:868 stop:1149 length:282 start_codon:yes stop_codon:yes gene_type:complete
VSKKLLHNKYNLPNNEIVEVKVWRIEKSKAFPEGLKYSFVYIKDGKRILGYDNEREKGHHRHFKGKEEKVEFKGIVELKEKFVEEVERLIKKE